MIQNYLDFEKPIAEIEEKLKSVDQLYARGYVELRDEKNRLKKEVLKLRKSIYSKLTPWQITQVARHPARPYTIDYIKLICNDFIELHGDREFGDDPAIMGGLANIGGIPVVLIGHQKGRNTKEKIYRNFGMPNPEGYRKALRLMLLAERFGRPIVTFVDTPGAFPGVGAEERGQSEAIARNLLVMSQLQTSILTVVIGEGGSGGALAIAVADRVLMMEFSVYSVISPEGCAAILWKDGAKSDMAAKELRINAGKLKKLGIVDNIIKEPLGGAHVDWNQAANNVKKSIVAALDELTSMPVENILRERSIKYRDIGVFKPSQEG